jgi:hypothetical protein
MTTAPAQCSLSIVAIRRVWQGRPSWRGFEEVGVSQRVRHRSMLAFLRSSATLEVTATERERVRCRERLERFGESGVDCDSMRRESVFEKIGIHSRRELLATLGVRRTEPASHPRERKGVRDGLGGFAHIPPAQ